MNEWMKEWPEEAGYYWFYGWCSRLTIKGLPKIHFVRVREAINGVSLATEGRFLYKSDGARGVWQKVSLPELPSRDMLDK